MMDLMGLTYTHSGLATSVIAIDKELTKQALVPHGIPMPGGRGQDRRTLQRDPLPRPYVLKPVNEGSSVAWRSSRPRATMATDQPRGARPLAGIRRTAGRAVHPWPRTDHGGAGRSALMVTELKPKTGFYDFDAKYTDGLTEHVCPAEIPEDIAQACKDIALRAHKLLGCKGTSRSDFRWDDERGVEGLFLLEVNTQPGMTPSASCPNRRAIWAWTIPIWSRRSWPRRWPMPPPQGRRRRGRLTMAQTIRRGARACGGWPRTRGAKAKVQTARKQTGSAIGHVMRVQPFSDETLHRIILTVILVAVAGAGWAVASMMGVPDMAESEVARVAHDAGFDVKRVEVRGSSA
jgi:hypothetical protein